MIRDQWEIRKLTPYECFMLQGYPADFSLEGIPTKSAYRQAGNTVCVPVVRQFAEKLVVALNASARNQPVTETMIVGKVRNRQQLEAALSGRFYHFPVKYMPADMDRVKYVALYLPSWLTGREAGIRYIGRIRSYEVLPRSLIRELPRSSEEVYCRIDVTGWDDYSGGKKISMAGPVAVMAGTEEHE